MVRLKAPSPLGPMGGITLIELLVAMVIMSVITVGSYGLFELVQQAKSRITIKERALVELQQGMNWLFEDINHMIARPVADELGILQGALVATASTLEFTRNGQLQVDLSNFQNANDAATADVWSSPDVWTPGVLELSRVAYALEEGLLIRRQWQTLDRTNSELLQTTELLQGVSGLAFRFFHQDLSTDQPGRWHSDWPPASNEVDDAQTEEALKQSQLVKKKQLPQVVEVSIDHVVFGRLQRWIQVASFWPKAADIDQGEPGNKTSTINSNSNLRSANSGS